MGWCLAPPLSAGLAATRDVRETSWLTRFDPRFWTLDFPRPMMACVVAGVGAGVADALRVDLSFTAKDNLAGLIWDSVDRWDHPLCAYLTDRDYRRVKLKFRWRSAGVKSLDAVHGPVLTIEGRDAAGNPRAWYVRLWNYAVGTPTDAVVTLDFGALDGGFLLPGEASRVYAGDVDRMFISLVPPDYDGAVASVPYAATSAGWVELTDIACTGSGAVLRVGDAMLPGHGLSIATAYDDCYNLTPQRVVRLVEALGYDGAVLHYVGMSHYARLARSGAGWAVSVAGGALAQPAEAWHRAFASAVKAAGRSIIWSLSYELFADYCPAAWMQRASDGTPALTGWVPPSALLSPANDAAMGYLAFVLRALVGIARDAALPIKVQLGEPWWWVTGDRRICLYDASAVAALGANLVALPDLGAALTPSQKAMLDAAGVLLAGSTAALSAAVRDEAGAANAGGGATMHLLAYLPTILDAAMPEARRANLPVGWARPAFDVLQLEDYDWAARGQAGASAAGVAAAEARLGYPAHEQHYLAGFVLGASQRGQWGNIDNAAMTARARGVAATFIWALPQVARDGFVHFGDSIGDESVQAFDAVDFPIAIGREASVTARFSTAIVTAQSGHEQRSPDWTDAQLAYDVGPGVRSEADVRALIAFYRARRGPAVAFRLRDPMDASSAADEGTPVMTDQLIGTGDGVRTDFALVKTYGSGAGAPQRRITQPVAGSVLVSVGGVAASGGGWTGVVQFAVPPGVGASVRAGYRFDVPVRFAEDMLEVSRATFMAGAIASVPLVEVRGL